VASPLEHTLGVAVVEDAGRVDLQLERIVEVLED
jgi:hypothetical protein